MLQRLDVKLVLAAISGAMVGWSIVASDGLGQVGWLLESLIFYGLSGGLFASSILWPYLRRDDHFLPRAIALVAASVLSFWCALNTPNYVAAVSSFDEGATQFIACSIVGAGIVFGASKFIVPFKWSVRYLLLGSIAGIVAGWAFDALTNTPVLDIAASFIAWHCIVCAGMHFGTRPVGETAHA